MVRRTRTIPDRIGCRGRAFHVVCTEVCTRPPAPTCADRRIGTTYSGSSGYLPGGTASADGTTIYAADGLSFYRGTLDTAMTSGLAALYYFGQAVGSFGGE